MLSFFPRDVYDEILNLIESVSKGFPSYSWIGLPLMVHQTGGSGLFQTQHGEVFGSALTR